MIELNEDNCKIIKPCDDKLKVKAFNKLYELISQLVYLLILSYIITTILIIIKLVLII